MEKSRTEVSFNTEATGNIAPESKKNTVPTANPAGKDAENNEERFQNIEQNLKKLYSQYQTSFKNAQKKFDEKIDKFDSKTENKFQGFYTVFGILFAVFAIGTSSGTNYSGLDLVSLWLLAAGLVGIFLATRRFDGQKQSIKWYEWIIPILFIGASVYLISFSSHKESEDREKMRGEITSLKEFQMKEENGDENIEKSIQEISQNIDDLEKRLNNARIR